MSGIYKTELAILKLKTLEKCTLNNMNERQSDCKAEELSVVA